MKDKFINNNMFSVLIKLKVKNRWLLKDKRFGWKSVKETKYTISSVIHVFYLRVVLDSSQKINHIVLNHVIILLEPTQEKVKQLTNAKTIAWEWYIKLKSSGTAKIHALKASFQIIVIENVWVRKKDVKLHCHLMGKNVLSHVKKENF